MRHTSDSSSEHVPRLYGRDVELYRLRSCLEEAIAGRPQLVLVGGEAGIGKTTLVEVLAHDARARGAIVLTGRCDDFVTPPYGPWIEIVRDYGPSDDPPPLPSLVSPGSSSTLSGRDELFLEARSFITAVANRQPLMLVLEDVHWADDGSLDLLRFVATRLDPSPTLIVATYRDDELSPRDPLYQFLPRIVRDARAERITLRRLTKDTVRQIVADQYALNTSAEWEIAHWLHHLAEGNPLFIAELLHTLEHEAILYRADEGWKLADLRVVDVPPLIQQVIHARLSWLGDDSRRLLQIGAVIGVELPLQLWRDVAGVDSEAMADALEQARDARVIEELTGRPGYRFRHALIRESLYNSLVLPRRQSWHSRIAELIASQPDADPDTVAHHLTLADDPRAADWLIRAGDRANRAFAYITGARRYEQALELLAKGNRSERERAWLLCALAQSYRYSDARRALEYLDQADALLRQIDDDELRVAILWSRTQIRGLIGESSLADLNSTVEAYALLYGDAPEQEAIHRSQIPAGHGVLANWLARHGCYDPAIELAERVRDSHDRDCPSTLSDLGRAYCALGLAHAALGRVEDAGAAFRRGRSEASRAGDHHLLGVLTNWEMMEVVLPYHADDPGARIRLSDEASDAWEKVEMAGSSTPVAGSARSERPKLDMTVFALLLLDGRWEQAHASATVDLTIDSQRFDALRVLCDLEYRRGNGTRALQHLHAALPHGPATEPANFYYYSTLWLQRLGAQLALDAADADTARAWIEAHDRWLSWSGRLLDRAASMILWSRYHLLLGDHDAAVEFAGRAFAQALAPRQPLALLETHRALGHLDVLTGSYDSASRHFSLALDLADACAAPYERALVLIERAALAVETGDESSARADLDDLVSICTPLSATPVLERADTLLRHLGIARRPDLMRLSAREIEVLRLVAKGLSNAEVAEQLFISPRTVAQHLQSIYNKIGISTRTAAAAFAYEHNLVDPRSIA